ncbi:glycoside hydrolase family 19 protein [Pandoraea sp. NPDC090278]|uniref:glycoside hydrolase family 19 protein n=1 Tax=Pandoraea sp. NPDC090278 TaxID=3364391 RepID=UPI00383B7257
MTTNSSVPAVGPASGNDTKVKPLPFAFPFQKKGNAGNSSPAQFSDEHEIYQGLLSGESSGAYLVGRFGMWHGGIHVTAAGFGRQLDLAAGVRCIADGEVVAYRFNQRNLTSERPEGGGSETTAAQYSTGFALVRHKMEFPKNQTLEFLSLYMHLMAYDDYLKREHSSWAKPAYWPQQWEVSQYAQDSPEKGKQGQLPDTSQRGLRVRARANGRALAILPQGARVTLETPKDGWAKLKTVDLQGKTIIARREGEHATLDTITGGWICIGEENGGPLVQEMMPGDVFDNIQFPSKPVPIKAGDLVGHLGRYDKLEPGSGANSQVHIETFAASDIGAYINKSRDWVRSHGAHPKDWAKLGLPSEPTILRVAPGTVLYARPGNGEPKGTEPQTGKTEVVQTYATVALGRDKERTHTEPKVDASIGRKVAWWRVQSADSRGQPIEGWVRDFNHSPGKVTLEFSQEWADFECIAADHDTSRTIFTDAASWVEYAAAPDTPGVGARAKLSPLMQKVHDAIFKTGNGERAAFDLTHMPVSSSTERSPWSMRAASRLIVKHESEWSIPSRWTALFAALEAKTGPSAKSAEEKKRIEKLVWWEDVSRKVPGFPANSVFHINPIALAANFQTAADCQCNGREMSVTQLRRIASHARQDRLDSYIESLNTAFNDFHFNSCISRAHFLAQILHESAEFSATVESSGRGSLPYDPWRGRGLLQLTFENNYKAYEEYSGEDFTSNTDAMNKLSQSPHAMLSAAWFYSINSSLIPISDGDGDDFIWLTRKINGGFNGYDDRLSYFMRAVDVLGITNCLRLNRNGSYKFEESTAHDEKRASVAWGMWNDPGLRKHGIATKSASEAAKGYKRYVALYEESGKKEDRGWYGIPTNFTVREYVQTRLRILGLS